MCKYRSKFECTLHKGKLKKLVYEPKEHKLAYNLDYKYLPDFYHKRKKFFIEAKGRFRTSAEARKYREIKRQHPQIDLRFVVMDANVRAYPGSRETLGDWLTRHGFQWCTEATIPDDWR